MRSILTLLLSTGFALAHHGQDFFVTLDARVPAKNGFSAFTTAAAGEDDFTLETGLIAGLGAGLAAGFTVDFSDTGSFRPKGITPILQWSVPLGESPLRLGAAFSHHFSDSARTTHGGGGHSHGGHSHSHAAAPAGFSFAPASFPSSAFGFNPDAPPPPTPQPAAVPVGGSSTIHLHDEDYYLTRFILEYELGHHTRLVGNLILAGTSSSDTAIGYSLAARHSFNHEWAVGLEAIGDFNTGGYHQVVAGVIHSPRHDLGLRLGVSHGLGATEEGATGLFGITWRF